MSMAENAGRFATIVCGMVERLKLPKMSVRIVLKQVQSGLRNISQPKATALKVKKIPAVRLQSGRSFPSGTAPGTNCIQRL